MANVCNNNITIEGDIEEIKEFSNFIPEEYEDGNDVYNDLLLEYGCVNGDGIPKWFHMYIDIDFEKGVIEISGNSAWQPALELMGKISDKFKSFQIRYEYDEVGMDFAGVANICDGSISDNCYTYWEGLLKTGREEHAFDCFNFFVADNIETKDELLENRVYNMFSKGHKEAILEEWVSSKLEKLES